ncbi:MAG TPA: ABC transporter ATP-binding protein [Chthoniobacterales bacterium]
MNVLTPGPGPEANATPPEACAGYVIEVAGLTKAYQRWHRPSGRLTFAILQQLAQWSPPKLRERLLARRHAYCEDFFALNGISFRVERGKSLGIIGKNGSGKSTLLQIIAGTLRPTSGTVEVRGRVAALLELGSGFNPDFTGEENVRLNAALLGMTRREIDAKYDEVVRFADIGDFVAQPVKTYSSGMLVRLAFSVAVHANADVLIVDEALAVGDVFFQQKCYRKIREIMERGVTFLFVSHDHVALQNLCEHGIILERGCIAYEGPAEQCAHRYMRQAYGLSDEQPDESQPVVDLTPPEPNQTSQNRAADREAAAVRAANILHTAKARQGGAEMEFLAAAFTDPAGHPLATVAMGNEGNLSMFLRFNQGIKNPEVAFRLIDRLGNTVFCTCNGSLGHHLGDFQAGEELLVRFKIRFSVAPGPYTFTLEAGKRPEDRPNMGVYFDVIEGVGPIQIYDPAPDAVRPFYGMAQLPCEMERV